MTGQRSGVKTQPELGKVAAGGTCLGVAAHVLDAAYGLDELRHTLVFPQRDLQPRGVAVLNHAHLEGGVVRQSELEFLAKCFLKDSQPLLCRGPTVVRNWTCTTASMISARRFPQPAVK